MLQSVDFEASGNQLLNYELMKTPKNFRKSSSNFQVPNIFSSRKYRQSIRLINKFIEHVAYYMTKMYVSLTSKRDSYLISSIKQQIIINGQRLENHLCSSNRIDRVWKLSADQPQRIAKYIKTGSNQIKPNDQLLITKRN